MESLTRKPKERAPDLEVVDDEGIRHRLWQVTDPGIIEKAHDLLDNKPLFIADGHHRYETALAYRNFMREKHPDYTGKELFNYVLMYFGNMEDKGMQIFPTHRMVFNLAGFQLEPLLSALEDYFHIEAQELDPRDPAARRRVLETLKEKGMKNRCLAMLAGQGRLFYLTLRDASTMNAFFDEKSPKVFRTLDVSILHRLILEKLLHISPEAQEQQTQIKYVRDFDEPFEKVEKGEFQLAFLMNPTRMNEVRDVANAGEKMPYKSTFFYPKLLSGLVINKIAEGEMVEG
jgi:uncharacterized protein (DUF1015 family)